MASIYHPNSTNGRIRRVLNGDAIVLDDGEERQRQNDGEPLDMMDKYDRNVRSVRFMEYVEGLYGNDEDDEDDNYRMLRLPKSKKKALFHLAMTSLLYDYDADDIWSEYIQYRFPTFEGRTVFVSSSPSTYTGVRVMFTIKLRAEE